MMLDTFERVLFIGAHPDDEIACSGLLSRLYERGARIEAMAFCDCAGEVPDGFTADDLMREWYRAWQMFGVEAPWMGDFINQHMTTHRQGVLQALWDRNQFVNYDLVLLPAASDIHQDHSVVREEGIRAFKHTTILGYEHPQNSVRPVALPAYVSLSHRELETKVRHAQTYESQAHRPYMRPEFITGHAYSRGVQIGQHAAEAFEVIRWVM